MKTKSALSYFGSDSEVAKQLAGILKHCKHVTIPFVGGGSIIPYLSARAIVANDLNKFAIKFYWVISGVFGDTARDELIHRCQHTLSHPAELERANNILSNSGSIVGEAWAYWALCWIGRKGKGGTKYLGGLPSVRRTATGGTNATRLRAAADDLQSWAKHLERCEWESVCFRELLPKVADREDCGIYADPPWWEAGAVYLHPFTEQDHIDFASSVQRFQKTTVLIRYGDAPLIRRLYQGWNIIEAESRDQCNAIKGELWITNKHEA